MIRTKLKFRISETPSKTTPPKKEAKAPAKSKPVEVDQPDTEFISNGENYKKTKKGEAH